MNSIINHIVFFIICLSRLINLDAQSHLFIKLKSNQSHIPDSIFKLDERLIVFFCPDYSNDSLKISENINSLLNRDKIKKIKDVRFGFIYFNPDKKNNSKGIKINTNNNNNSIYINEFGCYFLNFDEKSLTRAVKKYSKDFYSAKHSDFINTSRIETVDSTRCFRSVTDRIPLFENLIYEVFYPKQTQDEINLQLSDSIKILYSEINKLKISYDLMHLKLDSLNNEVKEKQKKSSIKK